MGVKFDRNSKEEMCGADCDYHPRFGWMACARRAGHLGEHISMVGDAAKADGVEHCCRTPKGSPHRPTCWRLNDHWNNSKK